MCYRKMKRSLICNLSLHATHRSYPSRRRACFSEDPITKGWTNGLEFNLCYCWKLNGVLMFITNILHEKCEVFICAPCIPCVLYCPVHSHACTCSSHSGSTLPPCCHSSTSYLKQFCYIRGYVTLVSSHHPTLNG